MNNDLIIVTGATGALGSQIVARLLQRVPAERVAVSVRDPRRVSLPGVEVRQGDFTDPGSLDFTGAGQVLIVSSNTAGAEAVTQHGAAVDAARAAGAGRILYTSHQGAGPDSRFAPMPDHAMTEAHLAASGVAWTALRNGFYASTIPRLLGGALQTGELVAPADGPVSWTAHADLAEAAAAILAGAVVDGPTPPLTAPAALDLEAVAAIVTRITGRTVRRVVADDEEWVAGLESRGVPGAQARLLLGMFEASRRGEFAATGPALEELIGRPATTVEQYLSATLASAPV